MRSRPARSGRKALAALALSVALATAAAAGPFEIKDNEGFAESMTALTYDLPAGWKAQGRIAWLKPCSGSELYEILFTATSPDGQSGVRMVPSHQIVWNGVDVTGVDPMLAQLAVGQTEQGLADLRAQFKNSNCHVGTVTGTDEIIRRLILPKRPAGARVLATTPNAAQMTIYRQMAGVQMPGMKTDFDAVILDLAYPGAQGELRERLWLSWYRYADDPAVNRIAGLPHLHFQVVTVDAQTFVWAPAARAEADFTTAAALLASGRADAGWQAKVRAEQQRRADERRRIQGETEAERQARLREAEAARQRDHERFLDMIRN
jgi:hypothetical protein